MDEEQKGETVELPVGEKIVFKSELFDVRVLDKTIKTGMTKDIFMLKCLVLDDDPLIDREAWVTVEKEVYYVVDRGEKVKLRLYEQEDGRWQRMPPKVVP